MRAVFNILMTGVGGQGIVLASNIVSRAAMLSGHDVKKNEIHGMSQRGGSVFSHVRFGEKVMSPVIPEGEAHILLALEEMESLRWLKYLSRETKVIVCRHRVLPSAVDRYPEGIADELERVFREVVLIDPEPVARAAGGAKFINTALLGVLSRHLDFADSNWRKAIEELVPSGTFEQNWKAFLAGVSLLRAG